MKPHKINNKKRVADVPNNNIGQIGFLLSLFAEKYPAMPTGSDPIHNEINK